MISFSEVGWAVSGVREAFFGLWGLNRPTISTKGGFAMRSRCFPIFGQNLGLWDPPGNSILALLKSSVPWGRKPPPLPRKKSLGAREKGLFSV